MRITVPEKLLQHTERGLHGFLHDRMPVSRSRVTAAFVRLSPSSRMIGPIKVP